MTTEVIPVQTIVADEHLNIVREASRDLIDARLVEMSKRSHLENMLRELASYGASVDSLSEASGLGTEEVRKILAVNEIL